MNNTYLYTRMMAEDVQTAELQIEYNKSKKFVRPMKPIINKKERLAEAVLAKMQARALENAA